MMGSVEPNCSIEPGASVKTLDWSSQSARVEQGPAGPDARFLFFVSLAWASRPIVLGLLYCIVCYI